MTRNSLDENSTIQYVKSDSKVWYMHSGIKKELFNFFQNHSCVSLSIPNLKITKNILKSDTNLRIALREYFYNRAFTEYNKFKEHNDSEAMDKLKKDHEWLKNEDFKIPLEFSGDKKNSNDDTYTKNNLNKILSVVKKLYTEVKKNDLIVVKGEGYTTPYLIGTVQKDFDDIDCTYYNGQEYSFRKVTWSQKKVLPRDIPVKLLEKLNNLRTAVYCLDADIEEFETFFNKSFDMVLYEKNKFSSDNKASITFSETTESKFYFQNLHTLNIEIPLFISKIFNPSENIDESNFLEYYPEYLNMEVSHSKQSPLKVLISINSRTGFALALYVFLASFNMDAEATEKNKQEAVEYGSILVNTPCDEMNLMYNDECKIEHRTMLTNIRESCNGLKKDIEICEGKKNIASASKNINK